MRKRLRFCQVLFFAVVIFTFSLHVTAATLSEYRENIVNLEAALNLMIYPEEDSTDAQNLAFEREVLAEFPKMLPARDKIEWQGLTVEVNNQWIYDALGRFENESPKSPKRAAILIEISERLSALEQKVSELENSSAANTTKDEDKQKLSEILRREEYGQAEEKQESLVEKIYTRVMEWLAEMFPRANLPAPSSNYNFQSFTFVLQIILYALILGAIGFLIYRFAPFLVNRLRTRETREKKARVILGERLASGETARNLFNEAEQMASTGDLRGAIRKGYIALLCELSDKKIITLSRNKTNRDYLKEVRKQNDLYNNINGLTSNYECHWYGFSDAEAEDWEAFRNAYQKAVKSR